MSEITRNRSVLVGLVLGLLLVLGNGVFAQRVSQETARSVAETFFNYNVRDGQSQPIYLEDITAETPFQNFYIFSADSGFVLVAADERVTPILGYSKASQFVTEDMPENLKWWLESYDAQIQDVRENSAPSTSEIAIAWRNLKAGERMLSKGNRNEVLDLTTKWDQGGLTCMLYNNACPVTNSGHRCVTGCTATAIAQALKYWDYPIQGIGNKTLNAADIFFETVMHPECYPISVDFSATTYDWQNMPDQLTCSSSQAEIDAIATLMLHCGVAMHMNYGLANNTDGGSSAPYLVDTISKYFDYSSCAFYSHRSDYSDDEWINMLKTEIDSHRPVLYRGSSAGGGHAFVFYGYDDNDMFMVNWGWSGQSDGYYAIGELNPPTTGIGGGTTYDFNENNAAIFYLMPNDRTLSPPTSFTVNNTANFNELQLVWSATLHAASYVILRNGEFLAETSSTSYIDGDIASGSSNTYQIITIGENHRASLPSGSVTYTKPFIITTTAFPTEGGTTTGDGHYPLGESCTVTATPNPGFTFMGWYGNALGTMLYSRQPEYTFTVTRDRHLYAKFVLGNYTVTTSCSPANGGTVSGNQGTYTAGSTVTLTATANSGYVFSCWTEDGHVVSTQPIYSFTALSNRHLVANFMQPTFSLGTLITNPDGSQGVVFYINPTYTGGCMVALEDVSTDCPWGSATDVTFLRNYTYTRNQCLLSDLDGYSNTAVLRENQSANPDYAPGKVDFEHGWYVPSAGQLRKIFSALPFIESAITDAGGITLSDNGYWSSTENSESNAWTSVFEMSSQSKTSNYKVRAVRDFSINNTLRVQVSTNNAELGSATGSGFYSIGSQVTVTAMPTGDNLFRGWTEKGHLVSQDPIYTFSAYANRDLVANFAVRGGVGTLVTNPDGSQGILFHLNEDGSQGWMVALEDASEGCQWGPESDIIILKNQTVDCQSIFEDQSGYYNTQLIRMTQGIDNEYAASIVDFNNGWYLPSAGQLRKLYAELPMLEEALLRAGGSSLTDGAYWSSTEYSASAASTPGFALGTTSKTSNCRVRAIHNYIPDGDHVVFVASNDENFGTVSGEGEYDYNETVTVTATPNDGYQFDHWTENGVTVSYDAEYQFPFTDSRSLVANFMMLGSIGSLIHNLDGSLGVVFYVNTEGTEGLMVALEDVADECPWGTDGDILVMPDVMYTGPYALCDSLGTKNTDLLRRCQGTETGYAADMVDVDNGWFLPSSGQLRKLYAALPLIEEQLVFAGGGLLTGDTYWSSTEYSPSNALSPMFEMSNSGKTANHRVRAVRSFLVSGVHSLVVKANDASFGSVTGSGEYEYGATVTVAATPNEGFVFDHWTEDGATVSYDATYQFTFTRNRSLVAHFVRTGSVGSIITNADGSRGVVFYSDPLGIGGLMVALDDASEGCPWGINEDIVLLENWNPGQTQNMLEDMSGYENTWIIRNWQSNNPDYAAGKVDYSGSWFLPSAGQMRKLYAALPLIEEAIVCAGGSLMTENLYWTSSESSSNQAWSPSFEFTKTNKTTDLRVRAIRSIMPMMMITATSNPEEGGTVSGAGAYDSGATCTLTAAPNEHFAFVNWTKDGQQVSTSAIYTFTVTEAADYVANFELNSYDITATANPDGGGTVTGSGTYGYGEAATLTAMANEGYSFQNWTENGEEVCAEAIYNFTVTGNRDLVANFVEEGPFIPTEDLVAYYPFDGDVNDYSGNDNHGTIIGNVVPVTDRHGNPHGAYRFPGVPFNYISVPDAEILHLNSFTLSAWVYTDAEDYGSGTLINKGRDINNGSYRLNVRGVGATTQYGGTNDASVEENPAIGQWHMITGTVEGDQARYYLDGVLLAENTLSHPFSYNNTQPLTLGVHYYEGVPSNWAYTLLGVIDEVRIYSRVFTPQEVQQLYGYEETTYDIEAVANPEEGGMVEGAGTYIEGSVCTLTAIPNENFTFTNWTRNGQMVSTTPTYSFTVTDAGSYVANFHQNICTVTVTVNPSDGGTVTGSGTYDYGTQVTLTATASEGYTFVNWTANGALLSTSPTCTFTVTGDTDCVARFLSGDGVVQTGSFTSGWNWWNTYIEQGGMDGLQVLEDGLGSNGIQIKSQQQYTNYYEGMGWMGMLSAIDNESTYKIKTNAACTVDMVGLETTSEQHPITIVPGWNWIGYPVNSSMSVATAFSNVTPASGDQVKAQNGYANYYDGMGWMGTLSTIEPGMGILYKSNGSGSFTLVYPTNAKGETLAENITSENNHWVPDMHAYPDNMTVTAIIELDDDELQSDNYELAAFADGECRGSVRLMYVEPLNRHMAFLTITGEEVTALSFSLYDTKTDEEIYGAQETLNFSNNAIVGDLREPYVLHFRGITGVDEWANRLNVFPNPVARGEVLNIVMPTEDLGEMRVEIINALGVVEACHGASLQTITAPDVAGVYTLHITVEGKGTCYRKLVVK